METRTAPATFTIEGTIGDDTLLVFNNGGTVQFSFNGAGPGNVPAGTDQLTFNGNGGTDAVTIDYSGGAIPLDITDNCAGGVDAQLSVKGDGATTAVYMPDATVHGNGTILVNGNRVITFIGLTPVDISGMATATVPFPGANDVVTIANGFDFGSGTIPALHISGTSGGIGFETVAAFNNTNLVINTSTVDGNDTVTINSASNAHNNTNISILTGAGTDAINVNGNTNLSGNLSLQSGGDITLGANASFTSTGGGNITFVGPVRGAFSLTVNTAGVTTFGGAVGNNTPLASLTTDAGGTTAINGGSASTTGAQTYNDAVTLGANTSLNSSGGNVTFATTVNGAFFLGIGADAVGFGGAVGGTTPLSNLNVFTDAAAALILSQAFAVANVLLLSPTAGVTQTAGSISAPQLLLNGTGPFSLDQAANNVSTLAAAILGSVTYRNSAALTIGTVGAASGITTSGGGVIINSAVSIAVIQAISTTPGSGGTLTVGSGVTINAPITVGAGNITLSGGAGSPDLIVGAPLTAATTITLSALRDVIVFATVTTTAATADIVIAADSDNNGVGGAWIQNKSALERGQLNSARHIAAAGASLFNPPNAGAAIVVDANPTLIPLTAAKDITLTGKSASAPMLINGPLNSTGNGKITIANSGNITIAAAINAGAGSLVFTIGTGLTFNDGVAVTANSATITGNDTSSRLTVNEASPSTWSITGTNQGSIVNMQRFPNGLQYTKVVTVSAANTVFVLTPASKITGDFVAQQGTTLVLPPSGGAPVVFSVGGNVTLGSGTTLKANIVAATQPVLLSSSGSVNLTGSVLDIAFPTGFTPKLGDSYVIAQSAGALNGEFSNAKNNQIVPFNGQLFQIRYIRAGQGGNNTATEQALAITFGPKGAILPTTIQVGINPNPAPPNATVVVTATVSLVDPGNSSQTIQPTGDVVFYIGQNPGTRRTLEGGKVSLPFDTLSQPYEVHCVYEGNPNMKSVEIRFPVGPPQGLPPTITGFTPDKGSAGASVTIMGANFSGAFSVKFSDVPAASVVVNSATEITATVPTTATIGRISVSTPAGLATSSEDFFPAPVITAVSPASAQVGATVTITGLNFGPNASDVSAVAFNGVATSIDKVISLSQFAVIVPFGATSGAIGVAARGGVETSDTVFTVEPSIMARFATGAAGQFPTGVAVGDFNGDGKNDVAVANYGPTGGDSVTILYGTGNGTFATRTTIALGGANPFAIAVGKFNNSTQNTSVVTGNFNGQSVMLLPSNGNGEFGTPKTFALGHKIVSIAVGDVNTDSKQDVVASSIDGTYTVLLGTGADDFTVLPARPVDRTSVFGVAIANFTGPLGAKPGLVFGAWTANRIGVFLGNGDGTFAGPDPQKPNDPHFFLVGSNAPIPITPEFIATGDFNGDGKADVATSNKDANTVSVLLGNGNGTFQIATPYATGTTPLGIAVSDIDNDGAKDLVVANQVGTTGSKGSVAVLFGVGDGTFLPQQTYPSGDFPIAVAVGDFKSGENLPEIVAASFLGSQQDRITLATNNSKARPRITSFSPVSGPIGTQVLINGENFADVFTVAFNGVPANIKSKSATQITVDVPTGASTGRIGVAGPLGIGVSAMLFTVT